MDWSQMSTFNVKDFWCNEFLAFFGNAGNYVAAFPKNAGNSLLEIKSRHLTWGGSKSGKTFHLILAGWARLSQGLKSMFW